MLNRDDWNLLTRLLKRVFQQFAFPIYLRIAASVGAIHETVVTDVLSAEFLRVACE